VEVVGGNRVMLPAIDPTFIAIKILTDTQPFSTRGIRHFVVIAEEQLRYLFSFMGWFGSYGHDAEATNPISLHIQSVFHPV
jgi:hypothetical protein